ncbi:hypothetical protein [Swaminathania salitolerans]|uniref:Cytochrome oxidase subunit I profile domain-containing protein n=1 Tax=Swaminathania salitolerans TaxID=182838 RepID=A0A511BMJ9_9PROT|nr:hypothetical protein [Swaminathania salitolerans]GEL01485.1 hypothetical protein SSA02_06480 [Swaminathania salitolerans]
MLKVLKSGSAETTRFRADGAAFLALALLCGFLGGGLGALALGKQMSPAVSHGLLLDLFVLVPAFIGGMGRLVLPRELAATPGALVALDRLAFALLAGGALCAAGGIAAPGLFAMSLLFWTFGICALATSTVVDCLECRKGRFRDLSPFAWSQLLASLGIIVIAPVMLAGVAHDLMGGMTGTSAVQSWLVRVQTPLLALVITLALGAIATLIPGHSLSSRLIVPSAMAIPSVLVPVIWAHGTIVPGTSDILLRALGVALPSIALIGLVCLGLWRRNIDLDIGFSWSFPALLLLAAGWALSLFPDRPELFHSAMLFGAIFALFGCYYSWQEDALHAPAPAWLARIHLVSMGVAVFAMMPMFPVLSLLGNAGMIVSMFCVGLLIVRFLSAASSPARAGLR